MPIGHEHSGNGSEHSRSDSTLCKCPGAPVNLGSCNEIGSCNAHFPVLFACVSAPTRLASCNLQQLSYIGPGSYISPGSCRSI